MTDVSKNGKAIIKQIVVVIESIVIRDKCGIQLYWIITDKDF